MTLPEFLTIEEVAGLMRCEHRTVRRAIRSGELQAALIGGRYLMRRGAVDAWFDARAQPTTDAEPPRPRPVRAPQRAHTRTDRLARLRAMERSA